MELHLTVTTSSLIQYTKRSQACTRHSRENIDFKLNSTFSPRDIRCCAFSLPRQQVLQTFRSTGTETRLNDQLLLVRFWTSNLDSRMMMRGQTLIAVGAMAEVVVVLLRFLRAGVLEEALVLFQLQGNAAGYLSSSLLIPLVLPLLAPLLAPLLLRKRLD